MIQTKQDLLQEAYELLQVLHTEVELFYLPINDESDDNRQSENEYMLRSGPWPFPEGVIVNEDRL